MRETVEFGRQEVDLDARSIARDERLNLRPARGGISN
jgi:hypothetical protein